MRQPHSLEEKLSDPAAVRAAGVKVLLDAHLKEMGQRHFRSGPPAPVPPWPDDSLCDPVGELSILNPGETGDWLGIDDLDRFDCYDDSEMLY